MQTYKPLIAICMGYFMVILDVTIVNVAIPEIAINMHISLTNLEWIIDIYTLTFASLLLSVGNISDRYGAKRVFQIGLLVFTISSLLCATAPSFKILILSRAIQGIGSALLVPTSISLLNLSYNKSVIAKVVGVWAATAGSAAASGPILGALLTSLLGWRAIFFINIPFGILGLIFTYKWVRVNNVVTNRAKLDFWGQFICIISILALAYFLIEIGHHSFLSEIKYLLIFVGGLMVFLIIESRNDTPMLPLSLFKSRTFTSAILVGFLLNFGFYGELFLLPMYFHQIRAYSIFTSGLAILPQMLLVTCGSYISNKFIQRFTTNWVMIIGLAFSIIGFMGAFIAIKYSLLYIFFIPFLLLIGFGTAFTMPAATIATIRNIDLHNVGIASGVLNMLRQIGSLVGVAVFGTIVLLSHNLNYGVLLALIGAIIAFGFGILVLVL